MFQDDGRIVFVFNIQTVIGIKVTFVGADLHAIKGVLNVSGGEFAISARPYEAFGQRKIKVCGVTNGKAFNIRCLSIGQGTISVIIVTH